jgi:hypothetical protein
MMNYQGRSGAAGAGELHTVMIGLVDSVAIGTAVSTKGIPQRVVQVRGRDFGKIFMTGVVDYWTFIGATAISEQVGLAYNFIDASQLNATPDKVIAKLIADIFFRFMDIQFTVNQTPHTIFELLAQQLESYGGEFPGGLDLQFLNGQGNFWGFFLKACSPPFHELWVDTRRSTAAPLFSTDAATSTVRQAPLTLGKDNSCPTLVMRPTPFPYLRSNGLPNADRWQALELQAHLLGSDDLSGEPFDEVLSVHDEEQYNFYLISPHYPVLPDVPYALTVSGIIDKARFKRYGYKPMTPPSSLLQAKDLDSTTDPLGIFYTAMNWRLASWNVLNDTFESGYKSFKLLPHVHVGEVVVDESNWQETVKEYYVESVVHHFVYNQRATTTLGLTRGLPITDYNEIGQRLLGQRLTVVAPNKVADTFKELVGGR